VGLSEVLMRIPMLVCGIASLVLLPLFVRTWVGKGESILLAWLLAVAPMHVYFSRYARPYGIALLLGFTGVIAAFRWWSGESRRWAVLFGAGTLLATYFTLTMLPLIVLPFVFFIAEGLLRNKDSTARRWCEVKNLGLAIGLGAILLLAFPLVHDFENLSQKAKPATDLSWHSVRYALDYLFSADKASVLLVMGLFALVGVFRMARCAPRPLWYLGFLALLQILFLLVARPALLSHPYILARYSIVLMAIALLLVSMGIGWVEALLRRKFHRFPPGLLAPPAALALLFYGPLMPLYAGPNNWTNHGLFQYQYEPELQRGWASGLVRSVPVFYLELGKQKPGNMRILEAPWYYEWGNNPYPVYQKFHKQWMAIGFVASPDRRERDDEYPLHDPRFRFRNFIDVGNEAEMRQRGVRYVVFHRNLAAEIPRPIDKPRINVEPWIERYRSVHGNPVFEDPQIIVFDLEKQPEA